MRLYCFRLVLASLLIGCSPASAESPVPAGTKPQSMDQMWGREFAKTASKAGVADRGEVFKNGHYGMFIHWGSYSRLAGVWNDKTYYGIGEWIMNPAMAGIPAADYMAQAAKFNPVKFDARAIAKLAKDAGMKYIVITSKHHEGFAMFKSQHPFNIVDATPFKRDPMRELSEACREAGLGFGFYYSHNQDWTAPGGSGGPKVNPDGSPATFDQYFQTKCYPQVREICTGYGPLDIIWFDTPGNMPKEQVVALHDLVRKTQPKALLGSRIGYGMGDYESLGDMEVPVERVDGLWETCDTTNDSWSYAWYDTNWKDSREILQRLIATVARGGTYLLNIGLDGLGQPPELGQKFLRRAGAWIAAHPEAVYRAGASPWRTAHPWGDVTVEPDGVLNLAVFDWPLDGVLYLPGLTNAVESASLVMGNGTIPLAHEKVGEHWKLKLPAERPDPLCSLIKVRVQGKPQVNETLAIHPNYPTALRAAFATTRNAEKKQLSWMEKFGEWKHATQVSQWNNGSARWTVEVLEPGDYRVELRYRGKNRLVWRIRSSGGGAVQNQQAATPEYEFYPMGILTFSKPGKVDLEGLRVTRVE